MSKGTIRTKCLTLIAVITVVLTGAVSNGSTKAKEYSLTIGNEQVRLVAHPELGYVVKSSISKTAMLLLNSTSQPIRSEDEEYLNVAGRPDTLMVRRREPSLHGEKMIRILSDQPDIKYIAPLFSSDGETIAIIPEIIVRLNSEADAERLNDLCQEVDCTIIRSLLYTRQEFLISPTAQDAEEVLATVDVFNVADFVEWAFPNIAFQPKLCAQPVTDERNRVEPNDTYFDRQWHLDVIRAPEAWSYANNTGDPNIIVAVLDYGVDINHPDLKDNIWVNPNEIPGNGIDEDENGFVDDMHGWDFFGNDNDVNPVHPNDGHGTACAGLIAARGNNNLGVVGVAWNCTIMPVCTMSDANSCSTLTEPVDGLRYAAAQGADVISNSTTITLPRDCDVIRSALKDITRSGGIGRNGKGCVVLYPSGNWLPPGGPVTLPAKYPEVIAVGAIDHHDEVWAYSGHGPQLDIVGPSGNSGLLGGSLWTTDISGNKGYNTLHPSILDVDYTPWFGGTSGSCPIVAGVVALMLSVDPDLTNIEVLNILSHSSRDLGPRGWDEYYGFGCVDALAAVTMVENPPESILFVDDDALNDPGPSDPILSDPLEDGSEEHPFDAIQEAINHAFHGDTVIVQSGTYTGEGNRNINFRGMAITVRSQDGADTCVIDPNNLGCGFQFNSGEGLNSVLSGFTITANGILCNGSDPTIRECRLLGFGVRCDQFSNPTITKCEFAGARLYAKHSKPIIVDCLFEGRCAERGGAIYLDGHSHVFLYGCRLLNNTAEEGGGAIYLLNGLSKLTVDGCVLAGNHGGTWGGGIYSNGGEVRITNSIISGNRAISGGGLYVNGGSVVLENCTVVNNAANSGPALYLRNTGTSVCLTNCIIRSHRDADSSFNNDHFDGYYASEPLITYSNIEGGWPSGDNIDFDPHFAEPGYWDLNGTPYASRDDLWVQGDYHLKSETGRWDPVSGNWVKDDVTSSCIDAGDPNSDWGDEVWPHGGRINMGAYGGTSQASLSAEPQVMTLPRVAYVYFEEIEMAESYQALLTTYGCPTTLIPGDQVAATAFDAYDLVIAGTDTGYSRVWADEQNVAAVEGSGKPVVGLGQGGYSYFGYLGLTIGRPHGAHDRGGAIEPVDPSHPLFSEPYPIEIPESGVLELCAETDLIHIYLYPAAPETVTTLGLDAGNPGYYSLVLENDRYLFWGFEANVDSLTEDGRKLFLNVVIRTANAAWAVPAN